MKQQQKYNLRLKTRGGGVAPAPKRQAKEALGVSRSIMDNEMSIISNHLEIKNKQRANAAGSCYDSVHQKYKLLDIF